MKEEKEHAHIWVRYRTTKSGSTLYRCNDPDCFSVVPREMLIGKRTLCYHCRENEFTLTHRDLHNAFPKCPQKCSMLRKDVVARVALSNDAIKRIFDSFKDIPKELDKQKAEAEEYYKGEQWTDEQP